MSESSDLGLLRRLLEFELSLERDSSEIVEEFDWGRLIYNPKTAAVWSSNYLEVHSTDLGAEALTALADEVQAPRGIEHRDIVPVDPAYGDGLVPGFRELAGWEIMHSVYMVLARDYDGEVRPAREVPRVAVEEVRRVVAEDDPNFTQKAIEQSTVHDASLDAVGNARWFAAPADGQPASACVLYERDGVGQVETVITRPEARNRGLATAVVLAAVRASREAGHKLTFIVADADDWPWKLYEKLGFDRVGEYSSFLLKPPQLRGEESP
jgi:ribosomal protein S18 acetylase RimI-like enzyme